MQMIHVPQNMSPSKVVDKMNFLLDGWITLSETKIAPKKGWLEYWFPFGMAYSQVLC